MNNLSKIMLYMFALVLTSCANKKSENSNEIILTPEVTTIKGDLRGCFEVVDRNYRISEGVFNIISVEIRRTDKELPFDVKGVEPYGTTGRDVTGNAGFGIEILDGDGNVVEKTPATSSGLGGMYSSVMSQ